MSINMKYGAQTNASPVASYVRLGRATANGVVTLDGNLNDYKYILVATYFSSEYSTLDMLPTEMFVNIAMPISIRFDASGTYRHITVAYTSDTTVTVSNRAGLNVDIYGVN